MTTPTVKKSIFTFLVAAMLLTSCASADKLVETGNYDQAIELAIRKLAGKKNKKVKYVQALEVAFAQATERDMRSADRLKAHGQNANWEKINDIYRRISRRQHAISPLLPLIDKEGIKAGFQFVRVEGLEKESREKAAAAIYDRAQGLLDLGRNGDRRAARSAYAELSKISKYYRTYRDRDFLMSVAEELGTTHILVSVENRAPVILPLGFEAEVTRFGVRDLDSKWTVYHNRKDANVDYDYQAIMRLTDIQLSPEIVKERQYEDAKEIEDGFDYVLDVNGNVAKDTLGNDIKVPRKILVRANVLEVYQSKVATIAGRVDLIDLDTKELIDTQSVGVDAVFENYASTFRGDERALSKDTRRRIGNQPLPFPTDEAMILTAAEQMKPVVKDKISRTRKLI